MTDEIIAYINASGVDADNIFRHGDRIGLYYLAKGADLKNDSLIYDRAGSSFAALKTGMIDWDKVFADVSWFHLSAICPALNQNSIGEAGNFPASIKTVAEWFPKKERALATGIFNSGSNIGAMIAAIFVPWCLIHYGEATGWKMAYLITGGIGFVWLIFWIIIYHPPQMSRNLGKEEYDFIHSDDLAAHAGPSEDVGVRKKISWKRLFKYPQTWAFFWGKFLTDGVWWFLLFWLPDYLKKQFQMNIHQVIWPTFLVYAVAIFGSTFGGNLPRILINKGMPVYRARMSAMFIIALFPLLLLFTQYFGDPAIFGKKALIAATAIIGIVAAAHQAWSANLFTTVSDLFPKTAVGSVTGIGGMAGGLGGVIIQRISGILNTNFHSNPQIAYSIMFAVCAGMYMLSWIIIRILTSRSQTLEI